MFSRATILFVTLILFGPGALADNHSPWGHARLTPTEYKPLKVVYDVTTGDPEVLAHVLDRVSYLSKITGADPFDQSIVLVLHGASPALFAIEHYDRYQALQRRAQSLTVGNLVTIRMCKLAAEGLGYRPEDIQGFVEMVPMGDAEIVRLQYEEHHAYMQ